MVTTRKLSRAQIARIVGNDPEAIKAFENLIDTGNEVTAAAFNQVVARVSSLEGRVDNLEAEQGVSVIRAITGTGSATIADDVLLADATAGSFTISLPTAATMEGRRLEIKKTDSTYNTVTIDPSGAELIDGASTFVIQIQNTSRTILSDGTEWWIL